MYFIIIPFLNLGTANDLLNQKFDAKKGDFRHQASVKTQSNGVTITSNVTSADENKLNAKVNIKLQDSQFGETTAEIDTAGKVKATLKLKNIASGLIVNNEAEFVNGANPAGKVGLEFTQPNLSLSADFLVAKKLLSTSAAYGVAPGVSVGTAVVADLDQIASQDPSKIVKADAGVQYEDGSLIASATVDAKKNAQIALFHRVNPDFQVASRFQTAGGAFSVGAQYRLTPSTALKGKATILNDGSHSYYGFIQHRMASPNVTIGLASTWNSDKTSAFGVNLAFGEL